MRKRFLIFLIGIFISLVFLPNVEARDYEFSCRYLNKDSNYAEATFELIGNTLSLSRFADDGIHTGVTMDPVSWNEGPICPSTLSIDENSKKLYTDGSYSTQFYIIKVLNCIYRVFISDLADKPSLAEDSKNQKYQTTSLTIERTYRSDIYRIRQETVIIPYKNSLKPEIDINGVGIGDKCPNIAFKSNFNNPDFKVVVGPDTSKYAQIFYGVKTGEYKEYYKEISSSITLCPLLYDKRSCTSDPDVSCVWLVNEAAPGGAYCNVDNLLYVGCGAAQDIPLQVPQIISLVVNILKIATPIILIFISVITLLKALAAQKDDEIKKATSSLIKKIIAAAMVFFIISIVQFVISKVASDDEYSGITDCFDCFLNNNCTETTYYKTVSMNKDYCTRLTEGETKTCDCLLEGNCE